MVGFRRLRLQGEEVTIWEIVAVAAAAGGKKEDSVGLAGRLLLGRSFRGRRRAGGREPGPSGQVLPARLGVSEYLAVQSEKPL